MRIKSYFAKTVDEAIAQAREELGIDALLLNTRKVAGDAGQSGGYEVVFGVAEAEAAEPVRQAPAALPPPESRAEQTDLTGELGRLNAQMDELRTLLERSSRNYRNGRLLPELADVYARLLAADVDPLLSQEIIDRLEGGTEEFFQRTARSVRVDANRLEQLIRMELASRVAGDSTLGSVVTFVGPTGAGKTTSLMKLAASDFVAGRSVRLLSLDTARVAPQMQLQYFASNSGIAFTTVPSLDRLPAMVAEARQTELVLIDTPGYTGSDDHGLEATASVLATCPDMDVHLVAPGYMKSGDLRRCIRRYEAFHPSKLLVTKLDETQTFGSMYSGAAWAGLKLSFMAHGQAIPGDIRPASLDDFTAMVLDHQPALTRRVA